MPGRTTIRHLAVVSVHGLALSAPIPSIIPYARFLTKIVAYTTIWSRLGFDCEDI